jgi:hypothetical protein
VRQYLSDPRLKIELDRFVTKHDRESYWRVFHGGQP